MKKIEKSPELQSYIKPLLEYVKDGSLPKNKVDSFMESYMYVSKQSDKSDNDCKNLYLYYNKIVEKFCDECYQKFALLSNELILEEFINFSEKFKILVHFLNQLFSYLDLYYVKNTYKSYLTKFAFNTFKKHFINPSQRKVYEELNKLISIDRKGNNEKRRIIKSILESIKTSDITEPQLVKQNLEFFWVSKDGAISSNINEDVWFYNYYIIETIKFAQNKANDEIHRMSAFEYSVSQLKYFNEEEERMNYINPMYHPEIKLKNYTALVSEIIDELIKKDSGVEYMLKNKQLNELSKFYKLINYLGNASSEVEFCKSKFSEVFKVYIKGRGNEIIKNEEDKRNPRILIPKLISLYKEMNDLIFNCFQGDHHFQEDVAKALKLFMQKEFYSKQLSNYLDFCMRIKLKGASDEKVMDEFNDIISLLKILNDKLAFFEDANKKLSDRLIKDNTLSKEREKLFISKLTQETGVTSTAKMTGMMEDLDENKKIEEQYKTYLIDSGSNGINFRAKVVHQGTWMIEQKHLKTFTLPKFLEFNVNSFTNFYNKRYKEKRKLIWCYDLSKVEIQYLFLPNKNISISTLPQLLILLNLEKSKEDLSIAQLSQLIGTNIDLVIHNIKALIYNPTFNPKSEPDKGLIIGDFDTNKKEFKENDKIKINLKFNIKSFKFNTIPLPIKKTKEQCEAEEKLEGIIYKKYKDNIIQSNITRIMKSRIGQETTHVWLINEAAKQIDLFKAQPAELKNNIEILIEKNIIKRINSNCYEYIA